MHSSTVTRDENLGNIIATRKTIHSHKSSGASLLGLTGRKTGITVKEDIILKDEDALDNIDTFWNAALTSPQIIKNNRSLLGNANDVQLRQNSPRTNENLPYHFKLPQSVRVNRKSSILKEKETFAPSVLNTPTEVTPAFSRDPSTSTTPVRSSIVHTQLNGKTLNVSDNVSRKTSISFGVLSNTILPDASALNPVDLDATVNHQPDISNTSIQFDYHEHQPIETIMKSPSFVFEKISKKKDTSIGNPKQNERTFITESTVLSPHKKDEPPSFADSETTLHMNSNIDSVIHNQTILSDKHFTDLFPGDNSDVVKELRNVSQQSLLGLQNISHQSILLSPSKKNNCIKSVLFNDDHTVNLSESDVYVNRVNLPDIALVSPLKSSEKSILLSPKVILEPAGDDSLIYTYGHDGFNDVDNNHAEILDVDEIHEDTHYLQDNDIANYENDHKIIETQNIPNNETHNITATQDDISYPQDKEMFPTKTTQARKNKEAAVVLSHYDDDNSHERKSVRRRFRPLQFWRNERVVYGRRESCARLNVPAILDVITASEGEDYETEKNKKKINNKRILKKQGFHEKKSAQGLIYNREKNKEQAETVMIHYENLRPKHLENDGQSEGLQIYNNAFPHFPSNDTSFGLLVFSKNAVKPNLNSGEFYLRFFVHVGMVQVTIHKITFVAHAGCEFVVPQDNQYEIKNIYQRESKLYYVHVKGHTETPKIHAKEATRVKVKPSRKAIPLPARFTDEEQTDVSEINREKSNLSSDDTIHVKATNSRRRLASDLKEKNDESTVKDKKTAVKRKKRRISSL